MTLLRPGHSPPAVRMPTRVQLGSWKIFALGPARSNDGSRPSFSRNQPRSGTSALIKTRAPSGTNSCLRTGEAIRHSPSVSTSNG